MTALTSKCGLTPQYEGLQRLHDANHDRGFTVLGFPANDFAGQEPGTDAEIAEFREVLRGHGLSPTEDPDVLWNFEKFLIGRDVSVVARFEPTATPDDPALVAAVDTALDI